jgi:membrane protein implicated in regulation of membrane protease activity
MSLLEGPALGWFALALAAGVVEVLLPHFGLIFAAIGAAVAGVAAAMGLGLAAQIIVFAVVLTVSLALLRPRLMRSAAPGIPSRTEQLTGKRGIVTKDIDPVVGEGRVNVGGEDWAARSAEAIQAGIEVRVVGADGIVLEVRRS